MNKIFLLLALLCSSLAWGQFTDVVISQQNNPYQPLTFNTGTGTSHIPWASVNNIAYVFNPIGPDSTVCIFVTNDNPTNGHPITLNVVQTGDPSVISFASTPITWAAVPITNTTFPDTVGASQTKSYFYRSTAAAKLALKVSGVTALGGSPDTVSIIAVQPSTASWCGSSGSNSSVNQVTGTVGNNVAIAAANQNPVLIGAWQESGGVLFNIAQRAAVDASTAGLLIGINSGNAEGQQVPAAASLIPTPGGGSNPPLLQVQMLGQGSDVGAGGGAGSGPGIARISKRYGLVGGTQFAWAADNPGGVASAYLAYQVQSDAVNPAAGQMLAGMFTGASSALSPYLFIVSCSAACDVLVNRVSTVGTTCTALTIQKVFDPSLGNASSSTASKGSCAGNPTVTYTIAHLWIAAGTTQQFDLSGYYTKPAAGVGNGFDVVEGGALTGTASVTLEWTER